MKSEDIVGLGMGWEDEDRCVIAWFLSRVNAGTLPEEPFQMGFLSVVEPEKYYNSLVMDIKSGPRGVRGSNGVLVGDLKRLQRTLERG